MSKELCGSLDCLTLLSLSLEVGKLISTYYSQAESISLVPQIDSELAKLEDHFDEDLPYTTGMLTSKIRLSAEAPD